MGVLLVADELAERCRSDGEFRLATRHWTGGFRLGCDDEWTGVTIADGQVVAGIPDAADDVITVVGPAEAWEPLTSSPPPPFANAISLMVQRGLELDAAPLLWWQYLPAAERLVELLRAQVETETTVVDESGPPHRHDAPTGRYVHVPIDGHDHRIYYETAGQGIPVLLQHTAGAHGVQWRHLFEEPAITDHFQLIAYDLPFHGKSVPPVSRRWWEDDYLLTGDFLRQVPLGIADALSLDDPVFMGCSVGGLLALDLAAQHPDRFRAVISVEGALHIGGSLDDLHAFWHPQVSNQTKARVMEGLCAPMSPTPYIKEVSQVYSAGWPPVFVGDLHYYCVDYDLRDRAHEIDTSRCGVHVMSGEYDYSGTVDRGLEAHHAIAGSTHTTMTGMGHFPMVENPELFIEHLLPILDSVKTG